MCNATEPRSKLLKSKIRPISATPSPGQSRSDLKISFLRESSPDAVRLQYNTRQGDRTLLKELNPVEDNDIDLGKSLRKRFSRSYTATPKRSSMRMSLGLSRSQTFNNEERVYERGSDENINNTIIRKAFRDELAALNRPLETTIEDDSAPERIISPIRRRSFFTPGLATRNPADMLAKPPKPAQKQQAELEYYYNPKCSTFSPLERIAALDLAGRPETPMARASTPGDLDYGLIGRMRITNGMSSPAPSSRSGLRRASTGLCNSVNYSDMPHMSLSEDNIIQSYLHSARQSGHFQHPLKTMSMHQDIESCPNDSVGKPDMSGLTTSWSPHQNGHERKPHALRSKLQSASPSRDVTSQIAQDYMVGLADNPFDGSSSVLNLQATSKPSEIDADLFDDSSLKPQESYETLQKSDFVLPDVVDTKDNFERRTSKLLTRIGTSSSPLGKAAPKSQTDHESLFIEDSGYSSNSSISSFGKKFQVPANVAIIDRPRPKKSPSTIQGPQQMPIKAKRRPTPVTIHTSTTVQDSVFSKTIHSSTDTLHTAATTVSFSTQIPQLASPKKLQKPRPRSQPPPSNRVAFQMHPEIDPNVIPRIPNELATRMAARVEEVPPLNHTLPSVDHLRLKKIDLDHPPLSAPIRFPSPEPMNDRLWAQVMKAQGKKQRSIRSRRSHADGLLSQRSRKKSLNMTGSALDLVSPRFVKRLFSNEKFDAINDAANYTVDDLQPQKQPAMQRSKSMATGLNERHAALSHVRSMAKSFDTEPLPDLTSSIKKSSSVYNNGSDIASSIWTNASPDLRQSSSVSTLATQSSSLSRKDRAPIAIPHTAPLPMSSGDRLFTAARQTREFHHLYESSSGESLNSQHETKFLPPLPLMPLDRHTKTQKDAVKKSESLEKTLPLLPHQKKSIRDPASRLSTPFDEGKDWLAVDQKSIQHRSPVGSSSGNSISTVQTLRETVSRHTRMQSEPPSLPSGKWQHQFVHSPGIHHRSLLPQLDTASISQGQHYQNLAHDYKLQSPYNRYLNRARGSRSESPEHDQPTWSPAIPELTPQSESDWERPPSIPPKLNTHDTPKQSPTALEGLVARMSGRFEGGLHYNYEAGHGIHGSAGTRSMQTGMKKSIETSKGYGLDLTDIPIFVYAQEMEKEGEQGGRWF